MIRQAKPSDIPAIVELGLESLNTEAYDDLVISPERVREVALACVSSSQHFIWVCETDGEITGSVAAVVSDMIFYERKQASVVMFLSKTPGEGIKLIRQFLKWARARPIIKMIEFTLEPTADPRIGKLLTRLGLNLKQEMYLQIKGGSHVQGS